MGIVWQQVGKISTHRLPTAGLPSSPRQLPSPSEPGCRNRAASRCNFVFAGHLPIRFPMLRMPTSDRRNERAKFER
jgi:hypothetical protein